MRRALVALPLFVVSACAEDVAATAAPGAATVEHVIDGDTLVVDIGGVEEHVRLIGIDTPETVAPERPVECWGPEASARTKELLPPGTALLLERDVEARDDFGRLLAYVTKVDDDTFVNLQLVEEGAADARSYPPNTARQPELDAAEQRARAAGAGMWGACAGSLGA